MSQKANAQGNAWDNARSNPGDVHKDADVGRIYQDAVQISNSTYIMSPIWTPRGLMEV